MTTAIEIDPGLREQAEAVLEKIGMTYSQAVNLFTRQIVLRKSFPVELNASVSKPLCLEDMTEDELNELFLQGIAEIESGHYYTPEEVERRLGGAI